MAYIGNEPTSAAFVTDLFSGNGSTVAFTMTVAPANTASILVAVSGVVQSPDTYSISGTTLTFSAAPPAGTGNISVRYLGIPATNVTTTAYRTVTEFTATAGQTTFSVPSYTLGYIDVYRNGVRLGTADYTATSGTTVVLANAATLGDLVSTESFYVSSVLNAIPATGGAINTIYLDAGNANGTGALLTPSGTTAQRPASPIVGMQRWNTTIGGMEVYVGNNTWQTVASTAYTVDYLVVAAGGSGGGQSTSSGGGAGGGGAGGLLTASLVNVSPGTSYTVVIGAGGAVPSALSLGNSGTNSSFGVFATAIGGGGGGGVVSGSALRNGASGGSGGGAGNSGGTGAAGSGTSGQGFAGGLGTDGLATSTAAGGGGGAGGTGSNAGPSGASNFGGPGGVGVLSSYSGTSTYYAGGGGGGYDQGGGGLSGVGGAGGLGGGGAGGTYTASNGISGTVNTGGGGGGAGWSTKTSGAGGSGVVIVRYPGFAQRGSGGTVTITGGYVIHTFTSSGTFIA
jgi:hypothetical protein